MAITESEYCTYSVSIQVVYTNIITVKRLFQFGEELVASLNKEYNICDKIEVEATHIGVFAV